MQVDDLANELNASLRGTVVEQVLSRYGLRAYFPKGIVAQSQEAASAAGFANATAGVAICNGHHMTHALFSELSPHVTTDDLVSYAPTAGDPRLRKRWQEEMMRKNPMLAQSICSLPVVTAGLTHGIAIAADLFLDEGDTVVVPGPSWDNYPLIFAVEHGAHVLSPSLFDENLHFSLAAFEDTLCRIEAEKICILLNFPNNPTGYTPSDEEMVEIVRIMVDMAQQGKNLVVVVDDAYYGLFHDQSACHTSLFAYLCNAHERLLAVKCDAATKESLVWGFRVGFITYGGRGLTNDSYHAMVQKTMGVIRASVSSCSRASQSLLLAALQDPRYLDETSRVAGEMSRRFARVRSSVERWSGSEDLRLFPCNSGYFCTFACRGDSEALRRYLLENHGIGTVSLPGNLLRIAYSGVDIDVLPQVVDTLFRSAGALWT